MGFSLQARIELGRGARTIVDILRERMDGVDRAVRRPSLKERLGLKGLSCCGPTWGLGPTTMSVRDEEEEEEEDDEVVEEEENRHPLSPQIEAIQNPIQNRPVPPCVVQSPAPPTGMNLAAALAAERQLRAALDSDNPRGNRSEERPAAVAGTPSRVSLMRLLEETTEGGEREMKREEEWGGCDSVCCVCMGRKKGAAFIPCGHTFCRVCSREMWLNRGCCPLCNRSILEILDIY